MNEAQDRAVIDVVEHSLLADRAERTRLTITRWIANSRIVTVARPASQVIAASAGEVVLVAVLVHVLMVATLSRPSNFYWLVLPAIAAAAAIVMMLGRRRSVAAQRE